MIRQILEGKTYKEVAKECDLTKDHMESCAWITRLMEEAGLPEPYRRLTEKPDHVPQWCSKHWLKAGHRKGGGGATPAFSFSFREGAMVKITTFNNRPVRHVRYMPDGTVILRLHERRSDGRARHLGVSLPQWLVGR